MEDINIRIKELDKTVCDNIELIGFASRGLISQNILSQSRNLVEHMAMKAYSLEHNLIVDYPDLKSSLEYIKTDDKYLFLREFHLFLQESRSHYGSSHEGAERLALEGREHELMGRYIQNNTKINGRIYSSVSGLICGINSQGARIRI